MKKRQFVTCILTVFLIVFTLSVSFAQSVVLQGWDHVDSGKHCDYDGDSLYMYYITSGATIWNSYKPAVIRKDDIYVIQDVFVTDYNWNLSDYAALTDPDGKIKFNIAFMQYYDWSQRLNVATHELGHSLGLGHNTANDIMYGTRTTINILSANDKASYDAAYLSY